MLSLVISSLIVSVFALIYSHFCVPLTLWKKLVNPKTVSQLSSFQQLSLLAGCIIQLSNILTIIDASLAIYYSSNFKSSSDQHWTPILLYAVNPFSMLLIAIMVMCTVQRNRHAGLYHPNSTQDRMQGRLSNLALFCAFLTSAALVFLDTFVGGFTKILAQFFVIVFYSSTFGCAIIAYSYVKTTTNSL